MLSRQLRFKDYNFWFVRFLCILLFLGDTFRVQNNIIVVDGFRQNLARWQI